MRGPEATPAAADAGVPQHGADVGLRTVVGVLEVFVLVIAAFIAVREYVPAAPGGTPWHGA